MQVAPTVIASGPDEIDYGELADDIAVEARNALQLNKEVHELDQRNAAFLQQRDPTNIMSVPGVGAINAAQILARLGDPNRFRSLAGVRSFSGLVPSLSASGVNGHHGPPAKAGDAPLREALFSAANVARQVDPTLGRRYRSRSVRPRPGAFSRAQLVKAIRCRCRE